MTELQSFLDVVARRVKDELTRAGLSLRVGTGAADPAEGAESVVVTAASCEEVPPTGNYTFRVDVAVRVTVDSARPALEAREVLSDAASAVASALSLMACGPLDDEGAAVTLLGLCVEAAPMETEEDWVQPVNFRAYIQI